MAARDVRTSGRVFFAFAFVLWLQTVAPTPSSESDSRYRPHCTLAGGDLPFWLALSDLHTASKETLRLADGIERAAFQAARELLQRHSRGHGGLPSTTWTATWIEAGSVPCDRIGLDALVAAIERAPQHSELASWMEFAARWCELNGEFIDAERLYFASIRRVGEREVGWDSFAEFLARRGRHAEALPLFERSDVIASCQASQSTALARRFDWIERSTLALDPSTCGDSLWERRYDVVGIEGQAKFVAGKLLARSSSNPVTDALAWFDQILVHQIVPHRVRLERKLFVEELETWNRQRHSKPTPPIVDISDPRSVESVVVQARELSATDSARAATLLLAACPSGLAVVGHAVLELANDPSVDWHTSVRDELRKAWRQSLLERTFGLANPDDPRTW